MFVFIADKSDNLLLLYAISSDILPFKNPPKISLLPILVVALAALDDGNTGLVTVFTNTLFRYNVLVSSAGIVEYWFIK